MYWSNTVSYAKILSTINATLLSQRKLRKWSYNMIEKFFFFIECFDTIDVYAVNGSVSHFRISTVLSTNYWYIITSYYFIFVPFLVLSWLLNPVKTPVPSPFHCHLPNKKNQKKNYYKYEKIQKNTKLFLKNNKKKYLNSFPQKTFTFSFLKSKRLISNLLVTLIGTYLTVRW